MLNNISLMGRMVKDVEVRKTNNDMSVASFTIAVDRDFQSGTNKITDFIDCTAWRGTAEFVGKYFRKGDMIAVVGSLQSHKWEDKSGNNRISWEVVVDHAYFCGSKSENRGDVKPVSVQWEDLPDDGELPF